MGFDVFPLVVFPGFLFSFFAGAVVVLDVADLTAAVFPVPAGDHFGGELAAVAAGDGKGFGGFTVCPGHKSEVA